MRIPAPDATSVELRFASLLDRDRFDRRTWRREALQRVTKAGAPTGWWQRDEEALNLPDGDYEYEFVIDGNADLPVADPFAEEITRFDGYRGIFRIRGGRRWRQPFRWDDELAAGARLSDNNEIVIYEMPLRWMTASGEAATRQVDLGTFEQTIFERLDQLAALGINTIELLPIQDSSDTLNWGYGTRFFFAPDFDMGAPIDAKLFVKRCHQRGIRVFLDVVMNHALNCPLETLADDWYFLPKGHEHEEEPNRGSGWGATMFRFVRPAPDGSHPAREFLCGMAEFWIREYHVDGFRIDEFAGIANWEFVQEFRERAWGEFRRLFPGRPFLVIAEDSRTEIAATQNRPTNPNGRQVVDAIWNFAYHHDIRRLMRNEMATIWQQPARRERIAKLIGGGGLWDDWTHEMRDGIADLSEAVCYVTSHDVQDAQDARFMNYILGALLRERGLGDGSVANVRQAVDGELTQRIDDVRQAHADALDRVRGGFGLLLTSVGIPMFLAGEEFADVHDLEHGDDRLKMSDPVDWRRADQPGHRALWNAVSDLVRLRTSHPALQRDEIEFFYFHPSIDNDDGIRVFAYCRGGGRPLGREEQVIVVANCGPHDFQAFDLPWPWTETWRLKERGPPTAGAPPQYRPHDMRATFALAPFQVRVLTS